MKFKKDIQRDSILVHAAMNNMVVSLAIQIGWTTNNLTEHGKWLKKQSEEYIQSVIDEVMKLS